MKSRTGSLGMEAGTDECESWTASGPRKAVESSAWNAWRFRGRLLSRMCTKVLFYYLALSPVLVLCGVPEGAADWLPSGRFLPKRFALRYCTPDSTK